MFNALLVTDGVDAYNPVTPLDLTALTSIYSLTDRTHLTTWYQPFKWDFSFFPTTVVAASDFSGLFRWELLGAEPFTAVENSVNGGAFSPATHSDGTPIVTNQHGNAADQNTVGTIGLPTGSYAFIFKAGNIVTSTITITVL